MPTDAIVKDTKTSTALHRDGLAWLGYLVYGFWCYVWGLYGPVMPFLRSELHLSYAVAAFHFSALALGLMMSGIFGHQITRRFGPKPVIWSGIALMVLGVFALLVGATAYLTISSALLLGFGGGLCNQAMIACLAERFKEHRTKVIAEQSISGSLFCLFAPIALAGCIQAGMPWKATLIFSLVLLVGTLVGTNFGGKTEWRVGETATIANVRLPKAYWLYFLIVFLGVSAEWSVCFWCTEYLEKVLHFTRGNACAGLSVFLICMLVGRVAGAKLSDYIPTKRFLSLTSLVALVGFLLFWMANNSTLALGGLVIAGLGQANAYPLGLSASIAAAVGQNSKATSTMSISTGAASLFAPLLLGIMADKIGLLPSFGMVAGLFAVAALAAGCADVFFKQSMMTENKTASVS